MKIIPKAAIALPLGLFVIVAAAGCSVDNKETLEVTAQRSQKAVADEIKPITLKIYAGMPESEFKSQVVEPMNKKYPQITIQRLGVDKKPLDQLIVSGDTPDIVIVPKDELKSNLMRLGLQYDLRELIKKYDYDLNRFDPILLKTIQDLGENGQLIGLPDKKTLYGLVYNKDIFDKFGVPYPKDGMTWEQTIELAKKLTQQENDIQYRGLDLNNLGLLRGQLTATYVDRNDKAAVTTPQWRSIADVYESIYQIPGNIGEKSGYDVFLKDRTIAMFATGLLGMINRAAEVPDMNWDVVSFPTFKEAPLTDPQADGVAIAITSTSRQKEEAFQVIQYLLSDEVQTGLVRDGFLTPLRSPDILKQLGANQPLFKGKNLQAAYKQQLSNLPVTGYDSLASVPINKAAEKLRSGTSDINTVLREAEEAINKAIASEKSK
ncbi:extracellular solute-binding protein [Paenibacillus allorhizosphaerae]|uniref:Extracellular solute-binding protein n=1 Tax=Paenibacillus allorhizosphaerae TaxID=2849866 RepID=A0ABM8V9P2_9BACL|nr:extracellular solute-binding protein [Paenibacillus allorhizosphaerae]CAG7613880.1 hypothetical protein PAECIP111802_00022 [Paenibacillus allorhizosphaerae]